MEIKYRNNNKEIFAPLKNSWLVATPEEIIRQETIQRLVTEFGYQLEQMEQDFYLGIESFKRLNESIIVIGDSVKADFKNSNPSHLVFCLGIGEFIKNDFIQAENYAIISGAKYFTIAHSPQDKREIKPIYRTFELVAKNEKVHLQELADIPQAIKTAKKNIVKQLQNISKEEFKNIFFACHDIIRNIDKFSPEMAFDEISKILFIKITKERESGNIYTKETFQNSKLTHIELFNETKVRYKVERIFDENDTLRVRDISFNQIIEKLGKYNLSEVPEDIKGVAFEEFLGKTFRGDLGQFFTPRTVVDFMVSVLNPKENELICDPCCGSGGFLIESFKKIKTEITDNIRTEKLRFRNQIFQSNFYSLDSSTQNNILEKILFIFSQLEEEIDTSKSGKRLNFLSDSCIYGTDAEPRSARTAKMNMFMQGDGHSGVHHHDGLLDINGIYKNRFDVILTNPPFGSRIYKSLTITEEDLQPQEIYESKYGSPYVDSHNNDLAKYHTLKAKNPKEEVSLLDFYETSKYSSLTEVAFMERCLNLLKAGGRMGVVLPEGFLNGSELQRVREYIEGRAKLLMIVSIPQEVFVSAGASVKSSLIFLKKFTLEEANQYQQIAHQATQEIEEKYKAEREQIQEQYNTKKDLKKPLNTLNQKIEVEKRKLIKERFDYELAIVEIKNAGISSTGQTKENELVVLSEEFTHYQQMNNLWESKNANYTYHIDSNGLLERN